MRVAWWPNSRALSVASYRLRCLRAHHMLLESGHESYFFNEESPPPDILFLCKRYDVDSLSRAVNLRTDAGVLLALEICDNHFHFDTNQDSGHLLDLRAAQLREAILKMDLVVTSSKELARVVILECPQAEEKVVVIEDFVERPPNNVKRLSIDYLYSRVQIAMLTRWLSRSGAKQKERRMIWFGNHGSPGVENGMADLNLIRQELLDSHVNFAPLSLTVVSNSREKYEHIFKHCGFPTYYLDWHSTTIDSVLKLHGTALIPISISPFSTCKTANRIITCFQNDLSVVASRIPSYLEFKDAVVLDDWVFGLRDFCSSESSDLRHRMTLRGLDVMQKMHSDEVVFKKWVNAALGAIEAKYSDIDSNK